MEKRHEDIAEAIKGGFLHLDFLGQPDVFGSNPDKGDSDQVEVSLCIPFRFTASSADEC